METLHNQELVATILEDNVASELTTIQDFLRWTYSTFNRSDIYYGQGHDNAWDESLQLVLAGLQLPLDLPQNLFSSKLTHSEKEPLVQSVLSRIEQRVPVDYLTHLQKDRPRPLQPQERFQPSRLRYNHFLYKDLKYVLVQILKAEQIYLGLMH